MSIEVDKLCDAVNVERGVRQGCSLSVILFNLVIDPIIRAGLTPVSCSLGYMDDVALILDNPDETNNVLTNVEEMAKQLGLYFNPKKCGCTNVPHGVQIEGEHIPVVSEGRAYKNLGTTAFPTLLGGKEGCFQQAWSLMEDVEKSKLTPMQKLDALRSNVIPMAYHLLENSHVM